jgi:dihydrofolate reductase
MTESMTAPIRLYMSMSLDGFIAGPEDRAGQELGRNGGRLFNWLDDRMSTGPNGQVFRELMATGAVISGRRSFELARSLARRPPRRRPDPRAHPSPGRRR